MRLRFAEPLFVFVKEKVEKLNRVLSILIRLEYLHPYHNSFKMHHCRYLYTWHPQYSGGFSGGCFAKLRIIRKEDEEKGNRNEKGKWTRRRDIGQIQDRDCSRQGKEKCWKFYSNDNTFNILLVPVRQTHRSTSCAIAATEREAQIQLERECHLQKHQYKQDIGQ
ncbi:hypothetical protein F2P81_011518 [Scophthalmus maximus]|uniref:Uncharacterized protein n=1 Tax=Scophthalmus maximus TaxID=52904 RepID=A0A6A4SLV7_SCOMX|nr:hypothetical protein F2P81_011518 [Scophthalmus maximus]